jgi:hypothetical protein
MKTVWFHAMITQHFSVFGEMIIIDANETRILKLLKIFSGEKLKNRICPKILLCFP